MKTYSRLNADDAKYSQFSVYMSRVLNWYLSVGLNAHFRKASLGGVSAGAIGQFMASPTDLVKVHMQMEGRRRLEGKPSRYYLCSASMSFVSFTSSFKGFTFILLLFLFISACLLMIIY